MEHGLLHNQVHRLWYYGPMFRHERPQKGRYRQFYQLGVETYGIPGPDIDAEIILLSERLWRRLGVRDKLQLEINSLGSSEERKAYRRILVDYFQGHLDKLDADCLRRLDSNPLRILDSKNPEVQQVVENAPVLMDHIGDESRAHFQELTEILDALNIDYVLNTRLVRGLDYYSKTVFEWVSGDLGAQGTVCAGGRYDGLIEQLGGRENYAVGFAMGMERLLALCEAQGGLELQSGIDIYLVRVGGAAEMAGMRLAEQLREQIPGLRLQMHCGGGSFKSQFKKADKSGAAYAVIIGEDEAIRGEISIKSLRREQPQDTIPAVEAAAYFAERL